MDYRWHVEHDTCDIYLQRVWSNGVLDTLPLPQANWIGRPAYERDSINYPLVIVEGDQGGPQPDANGGSRIIEDGAGGIFAVWHDSRNGYFETWAQHVSGDGFPYWTQGGVLATNLTADPTAQRYPVLTSDGAGGILTIWQEQSFMIPYTQIRASRVTSVGTVAWEIGVQSTLYNQTLPFCISDDNGSGAWVVWEEETLTPNGYDVAVAYISNSGTVNYLNLGMMNEQRMPKLALDGYGGVFIAMVETSFTEQGNILVARVRGDMSVAWVVIVCDALDAQSTPWIIPSSTGEAIVAWVDSRDALTSPDIYAQKIDTTGAVLWVAWPQGLPICTATGGQSISFYNNPWMVSDAEEGAIITWEDQRTSPGNVYAQRVDGNGNTLWTYDGVLVCDVKVDGGWGGVVSDDYHGAIICWCDGRDGLPDGGCNIYTQRVYADGSLAPPEDACELIGVWNYNVFPDMDVTDVWDMEKEDWCLCSSPDLPNPPYEWCPEDIAGTIVVGFTSISDIHNYALICNCMDDEGNPQMPGDVYYYGAIPLEQTTAVACDDRGPEVEDKSFWWGDNLSQLLLHTDLWGNILNGPFTAMDLGITSFPVTGLAKDEENHHLWAYCRDIENVFYEFDIRDPANPYLLQGPLPAGTGDIPDAAGLEYNTVAHRLIAINELSRTAECFRDNDPPFPGGGPWPGVDFINSCELFGTNRPFGVAVKDGRGPGRRGVLEIIDQTMVNTFPLMAFEPPCAFPGQCPNPDSLVIKVEESRIVLMWPPVPEALTYNVFQASEPFPAAWALIATTPDTSYVYVPPAIEEKSFFRITSVCTENGVGSSNLSVTPRCKH